MAKARMRRVVCFDTTPMIWGVREDADDKDHHMIETTKQYIKQIQEDGFVIMVPTPVVSEYLVGATATQFHEIEILKRGFEVHDFDIATAQTAALLQRGGMVNAINDEYGTPKRNIRIDAMIIAIALEAKAEWIVTNNVEEFKKLAAGKIEIRPVKLKTPKGTTKTFDPSFDEE